MAEVEYMHLCDYAFPGQSGKPCVIGIFDRIRALAFPVTHGHMHLAVQLRGQQNEIVPIKIELCRPNGEVLVKIEGRVSISPHGGSFTDFILSNIRFPEPGTYTVKVLSAGRPLATQSLYLQQVEHDPQPPPGMPLH